MLPASTCHANSQILQVKTFHCSNCNFKSARNDSLSASVKHETKRDHKKNWAGGERRPNQSQPNEDQQNICQSVLSGCVPCLGVGGAVCCCCRGRRAWLMAATAHSSKASRTPTPPWSSAQGKKNRSQSILHIVLLNSRIHTLTVYKGLLIIKDTL